MARPAPRRSRWGSAVLVLACSVCLGARGARADEECPDDSRADAKTRRLDAKRFFDRAQKSQGAGDEAEALRAYQCSLSIVSHPFTAFNVARLADKRGDAETALSAYRLYLDLSPAAPDREQVSARIDELQAQVTPTTTPPPRERAAPEPAVAPPTPKREAAREPEPPSAPAPTPAEPRRTHERSGKHVAGWVLTGAGAAVVAAGVALNLMARDDMHTCRARYAESMVNAGALQAAHDACDAARPLAYASYAAFGVGAAAAAAGITLWTLALREEGASPRERPLAWIAPTAGGALFAGRFSF